MSLDIIQQPFAFQGDRDTPDQTSATGFVNFQDGYTKDYEISLASGNPQAKAVERMVQNYMFNQATEHAMAWQRRAMPPWFAGMSDPSIGGYPKDAFVIRQQVDLSWKPYRSLVANNVSDPLTTPSQWEYVRNGSESLALIPMPSGAGSAAAELIVIGVDFNTLTSSGTYEVRDETVFGACSNTPSIDGNLSGVLEVKSWTDTNAKLRVIQRYTGQNGRVFGRYSIDGAWITWTVLTDLYEVRRGKFNVCSNSSVNNQLITLVATPPINNRVEGLRLRFRSTVTTTGTITIDDGLGAKPLAGKGFVALGANDIQSGFNYEIEWNGASTAFPAGCWVLVGVTGSPDQLPTNSVLAANPPQFDSTAKIATMAAVQRALGNFQTWKTVANGGTMAASDAGSMFGAVATGVNNHFLPLLSAVPIGATYTYLNTNGENATITRSGTDGISVDGAPLTSVTIMVGQSMTFVKATAATWLVIGNSGVNRGPAYRSFQGIGSNYTILAKDIGNVIWFSGNNVTITVPTPSSLAAKNGDVLEFFTNSISGSIIAPGAGTTINDIGTGSVANISLKSGQSVKIVAVGTNTWQAVSSTASLGQNADFANVKSGNGYQKLPSGIIVQWGNVVVSMPTANVLVNTPVTFPIPFPNTVLSVNSTPSNCPAAYINTSSESFAASGFTLVTAIGLAPGTATVRYVAFGY